MIDDHGGLNLKERRKSIIKGPGEVRKVKKKNVNDIRSQDIEKGHARRVRRRKMNDNHGGNLDVEKKKESGEALAVLKILMRGRE